jgi:RNA binding exosome subunit
MCLDQLLLQQIKQSGSSIDIDDLSRLLDGKELFIRLEKQKNLLFNSSQYSSEFNLSISNYP